MSAGKPEPTIPVLLRRIFRQVEVVLDDGRIDDASHLQPETLLPRSVGCLRIPHRLDHDAPDGASLDHLHNKIRQDRRVNLDLCASDRFGWLRQIPKRLAD